MFPSLANMGTEERRCFIDGLRQEEKEALRIERNDRLNRQLPTPPAPRGRVNITRGFPPIPTLPPARTVQEIEQDQILNRITEGMRRLSSSEDEIPAPLDELRRRRRSLPVALPRGRVTVVRGGRTAVFGLRSNQLNQPSVSTTSAASTRGQVNILRGRGSSLPRNSQERVLRQFGIIPPDSISYENVHDIERVRRAAYMRDRRSTASEAQRRDEALRSSQRRLQATPEVAEETRRRDLERQNNRRAAETTAQYQYRIQSQAARQEERRREETEEQYAMRVQEQAARQEQARLMETPEQREARRVADETRQQQARANQTNQQRAVQNVTRRYNAAVKGGQIQRKLLLMGPHGCGMPRLRCPLF